MKSHRNYWLIIILVVRIRIGLTEEENSHIQTHTFWPTPVWVAAPKSDPEQQKKFGSLKAKILELAKKEQGSSTISNRGGWQWPASDENLLVASDKFIPGVSAARQEILESIERGMLDIGMHLTS